MNTDDFSRIARYTHVGSIYANKSLVDFAEAIAYEASEDRLTNWRADYPTGVHENASGATA